jgi:hypothetical protein
MGVVLLESEPEHRCTPDSEAHAFERDYGLTYRPVGSLARCECGQDFRSVAGDPCSGFAAPNRWVKCSPRRAERILRRAS